MKGFLSVERLEGLSDSVLLVALTILAYNLIPPTLVNGQADPTEVASFFDNLYVNNLFLHLAVMFGIVALIHKEAKASVRI